MSNLMTNIAEAFTRLFRQNHRCIVNLTEICQLQLNTLLDKLVRANGKQLAWTIGAGATSTSTEIDMGTHTRIAFYGDTNNTTNLWIRIEYSQDGTNWFQGSEENAKLVIVSATGNFYDEEIVTPPRVRLWRKNTTNATETINLYWTIL
jgi:hypothetical protein